MTPIDLRRAGPGWTVHFRCGGQAIVEKCLSHGILSFKGFCRGATFSYALDGSYLGTVHPLDIIGLDPPPMTEAQTREALAEIAKLAGQENNTLISGATLRRILVLAEGKS